MTTKTKRRLAFAILFLWILPALACNFPTADRPGGTRPDIQETLMARLFATTEGGGPQDIPPVEETPPPPPDEIPIDPPELPPLDPQQSDAIFPGLRTPAPGEGMQGIPVYDTAFQYQAQSGDTLPALAQRFGVDPGQISSPDAIPQYTLMQPGQSLTIPNALTGETVYPWALMPDSEVVYSPSAADFDIAGYIAQAGGYLSSYSEEVDGEYFTAAQSVERAALETSTNPRILLSALQYQSGWVFGQPHASSPNYPMGFVVPKYEGLYKQLVLTQRQLTIGYYGWRAGTLTQLNFDGGPVLRISPELNAGTVAVQHLFQVLYRYENWQQALYGENSYIDLHTQMFGDPWARAAMVEPLLPGDLSQPYLELPFRPGEPWNMTGGPHSAWGIGSARGGLDFAPSRPARGCTASDAQATAAAGGLVTRSGRGIVVVDLDGDGREQTGWSLMYLHVATQGRVAQGTYLNPDDPVGFPSCEGGVSTGTHIHLARKYNGEWIAAEGPIPFVLSGWTAYAGEKNYQGGLIRGSDQVSADPGGSRGSQLTR